MLSISFSFGLTFIGSISICETNPFHVRRLAKKYSFSDI